MSEVISLERVTAPRGWRSAIVLSVDEYREQFEGVDLPAGTLLLRFQTSEPRRGDVYDVGGQRWKVRATQPVPPVNIATVAALTPYTGR